MPSFTDHEGHGKLEPLTAPAAPPTFLLEFLDGIARSAARPKADVAVLDVGCGRGDTVAWLCDHGWNAYGVDIDERYLDQGRPYLESGHGGDRLRLLTGRYPFPDQTFDVVLSDQVLEHVADLDTFFAEVARVSRVGAAGLHIFPARWRPVESHLLAPLVHWLPKGRPRRVALRALLAVGLTAPYFGDRPLAERVEIFAHYSDTETFYRGLGQLARVCAEHGLGADVTTPARTKVRSRLPGVPDALVPAAAFVYRHTFSVGLETRRIS